MGMHLSSCQSISINPFTRVCEELGLPAPQVKEKEYFATITKELYEQ